MQNPYFDLTVPVFIKNLANAKHILEKSFAHSKSMGMSEADFLEAKLAPDMFPLRKQVQLITDHAKGAPARLSGIEPLSIEDNETTVEQLLARIDSVIAHLKTFKPEQFTNSATQVIVIKYFPGKHFHGADYFVEYALPNFFFHLTMLYAIGRMMGVPLGKADFMGNLNLQETLANQ